MSQNLSFFCFNIFMVIRHLGFKMAAIFDFQESKNNWLLIFFFQGPFDW